MSPLSDAQEAAVRHGIGPSDVHVEEVLLPEPSTLPSHITNFGIDWHKKYSNAPSFWLESTLDPGKLEFLYEHRNGVYYGIHSDGWVGLHYHSGKPVKQEGYGGRAFELKMLNGTTKTLLGPWHGGASGAAKEGFPPIVKVSWKYDGLGYFGVYAQLPLFSALVAKFDPTRKFVNVTQHNYTTFQPLTKLGLPKTDQNQTDLE